MGRKLWKKIEGSVKENVVFGEPQTAPYAGPSHFACGSKVRSMTVKESSV